MSLKKLDEDRVTSSPITSPVIPFSDIIAPLQDGGLDALENGVFSTHDYPLPNPGGDVMHGVVSGEEDLLPKPSIEDELSEVELRDAPSMLAALDSEVVHMVC